MSLQDSYNLLEMMSKRFRLDNNVVKKDNQRIASTTTNNIQPENDNLCANMISEVVKVAAERVKGKQRMASVTNKIDEVGLLQSFLTTYQ